MFGGASRGWAHTHTVAALRDAVEAVTSSKKKKSVQVVSPEVAAVVEQVTGRALAQLPPRAVTQIADALARLQHGGALCRRLDVLPA